MDQEKIGRFILELRKKNNLTQKALADKLGVTYQAVSKWETGKNIPDISILKLICEEFSVDINDVLNINSKKKNDNTKIKYIAVFLFIFIFVLILIVLINIRKDNNNDNSFEFKTIEANCSNFNIYGNMAYNTNKSYLSISKVEYCGNDDDTIYSKIECSLYEVDDNVEKRIENCGFDSDKPITLNEYLENIKFNVNNISNLCNDYSNLEIKIEATDENNKITTYKIPLVLNNVCK